VGEKQEKVEVKEKRKVEVPKKRRVEARKKKKREAPKKKVKDPKKAVANLNLQTVKKALQKRKKRRKE
jgi:hypothetical protein